LIVFAIGGFFGLKFVKKTSLGKKVLDITLLKLPIFGKLFQMIYIVRFTRSIQTLLIGGVHISKGLDITAKVVNNTVYKDLINRTKIEVEDGNSMSTVFATSPYMPDMVSQMISIGEKTGILSYKALKIFLPILP
jgi:type IV pilus assembly protein PilC